MTEREVCPAFRPEEPYDEALRLAWEELRGKESKEVSANALAGFTGGKYALKVFQRECIVDLGQQTVAFGQREPQPLAKIIILHYLSRCDPSSPSGKLVSYRELPGGNIYFPAFKKRVIDGISDLFQVRSQMLLTIGSSLGGKKLNLGSVSVRLNPLPKLPVTVIVWKADREVHGKANLLFDDTAGSILPAEDLAEAGWFVYSELMKGMTSVSSEVMHRNTV